MAGTTARRAGESATRRLAGRYFRGKARSGEETPEFAAINIRTGLRQKWPRRRPEHHLVADIAWAVIQYWQTTGDEDFIAHEGMALLLENCKVLD
ncbi:hypothetical protein OHD50_03210 [Escherichia coli]|nr:hypothetical protein [Escherichia coli]